MGEPATLSPTRSSWAAMMARCFNPKHDRFSYYGGAGVTVCRALSNSPQALVDVIGKRPNGLTLDRIDSSLNYSCGICPDCIANNWPKNIRWATWGEQRRNQRRNELKTINGVHKRLSDWASESGLKRCTIAQRIKAGWPDSELLSPLRSSAKVAEKRAAVVSAGAYSLSVKNLSKVSGVPAGTIRSRIRRGYSGDDLIIPSKHQNGKRRCIRKKN
jgi:hypothetical protein